MTKFKPFFASLAAMFRPPFEGLSVFLWLYFIWCFLVHPFAAFKQAELPDPDDYMYLNQTIDWLSGQGWFDNVQHRLDPPNGVPIHFSRIEELPLALFTWLFHQCGLIWRGAATLAAFIVPVIRLAFMFLTLRWTALRFMPREWAGVTAFVMMFTSSLLFQFNPGRADHHGMEALLIMLAVGFVVRLFHEPHRVKWAIGGGFALALALAIALETLPWVMLIAALVGLWMMVRGSIAASGGLVFGLSLYVFSALFLALAKAPPDWFQEDILAYSVVYVILCASIALPCAVVALVSRASMPVRFAAGIVTAAITGIVFFHHFPLLIGGPYGAMDPKLAALFFSHIAEALPLFGKIPARPFASSCILLLLPVIALIANGKFLRDARGEERWIWGLSFALLLTSIVLSMFYQVRIMVYAFAFSVIPAAALLQRGWGWADANLRGRKKFWAELGLIMLVGPLPVVLLPAAIDGRPFNSGVLLFPMTSRTGTCDMYPLEKVLRAPPYGGHTRKIMSLMNMGSELIFRTPHKVISAPYHTNVQGNMDTLDFFLTSDANAAKEIAKRRDIDLVAFCRAVPTMYIQKVGARYRRGPDGKPVLTDTTSFIEQLLFDQVPSWLKPVQAPLGDYLLYEVVKDELVKPAKVEIKPPSRSGQP